MGFFSGVKRVVKPLVNFPRWMDLGRVGQSSKMIKDIFKDVITPEQQTRKEEFNQAVKRLHLTNTDLLIKDKDFTRLFLVFLTIAVLLFIYTIYLFIDGHIRAGILTITVSGIAWIQAFRFHFWRFQLRKQKLGCTFSEWLREGLF